MANPRVTLLFPANLENGNEKLGTSSPGGNKYFLNKIRFPFR